MVEDHDVHKRQTRRSLLQYAAGGAAITLAGCSGDSGEPSETQPGGAASSPTQGPESLKDPVMTEWTSVIPNEMQFNPYNPNNSPARPPLQLFEMLANNNWQKGGYDEFVAEEITFEPDLITIRLPADRKWHNGDQITAQDIITKYKLDIYTGNDPSTKITGFSAPEEKTAEFELGEQVNLEILSSNMFAYPNAQVQVPHSIFGEYLDRFEDAISISEARELGVGNYPDEATQVLTDLTEFKLEEPVGSGPFQWSDSATSSKLTLERFDEHPNADAINFSTWEYLLTSESSKRAQYFTSGQLDIHTPSSRSEWESRPQGWELLTPEWFGGLGLLYNLDYEWVGDPNVRKAISFLTPMGQLHRVLGMKFYAPETGIVTGFRKKVADIYLNDGDLDGFTDYGLDSNQEAATAALEEAGFSKSDGSWLTPDGDPFELPITSYSSQYAIDWSRALVPSIQNFGIAVNYTTVENTQFFEDMRNGDVDGIFPYVYGHRWQTHPYHDFRINFQSYGPFMNYPNEVDVPMPVGNADGSLTSVDVIGKIEELEATIDEERGRELIREIAWVHNQNIPMIPGMMQRATFAYDILDWNWPNRERLRNYQYPPLLVATGEVTARTE